MLISINTFLDYFGTELVTEFGDLEFGPWNLSRDLLRVSGRTGPAKRETQRSLLRNKRLGTGQKPPSTLQFVCLGASAGLGLAKGFVRELFLLP